MRIQITNPIEAKGWDRNLSNCDRATFFHSAGWAAVLNRAYRYRPIYFTNYQNDRIGGLLPFMEINSRLTGKRGVSLPFTDSCPPLAASQEKLDALVDHALDYGHKSGWRSI